MVKIKWIGEARELADPQLAVEKGDEVDVSAADAKSYVDQGLAERVDKPKKEND